MHVCQCRLVPHPCLTNNKPHLLVVKKHTVARAVAYFCLVADAVSWQVSGWTMMSYCTRTLLIYSLLLTSLSCAGEWTVQCSTIQYSTVQVFTANWVRTVRYGTVRYNTNSTAQPAATQHSHRQQRPILGTCQQVFTRRPVQTLLVIPCSYRFL